MSVVERPAALFNSRSSIETHESPHVTNLQGHGANVRGSIIQFEAMARPQRRDEFNDERNLEQHPMSVAQRADSAIQIAHVRKQPMSRHTIGEA